MVEQKLQSREADDTRPVLLLAADQGRFGRIGQVMRAWSPRGVLKSVGHGVLHVKILPALVLLICLRSRVREVIGLAKF